MSRPAGWPCRASFSPALTYRSAWADTAGVSTLDSSALAPWPRLLGAALGCSALLAISCAPRHPVERWHAVTIPTNAEFNGVWFTDSLHGWLTGGGSMIEGGIVGRTGDGGRTWQFQSGIAAGRGTEFSLGGVQFRDTLRGWAVGDGDAILVTNDGGESWRSVHEALRPGGGLAEIQMLDDRLGWAIGPSSVLRTDDGGETWRVLVRNSSESGYLTGHAIHFVDRKRGWLIGHTGEVMRSDDGGLEWERVPVPIPEGEHPTLWDVTFVDPLHGWIVGERGTVLHTDDGGITWVRQERGVPIVRLIPQGEPRRPREVVPELETEPDRLTLSAVRFFDASHGWAVGYYADVAESVVLRTDDGGATWRVERVQPGTLLRSLFVLDRRHAWAAGDRARTTPQVVLSYSGLEP
jgi:photosystem II stability/assembly factor-like uncharacterized protein